MSHDSLRMIPGHDRDYAGRSPAVPAAQPTEGTKAKRWFVGVSADRPMEIQFSEADGPGGGFVESADVDVLEARVTELEEAATEALNELGIPGPRYPAPVANAVEILRAVLHAE